MSCFSDHGYWSLQTRTFAWLWLSGSLWSLWSHVSAVLSHLHCLSSHSLQLTESHSVSRRPVPAPPPPQNKMETERNAGQTRAQSAPGYSRHLQLGEVPWLQLHSHLQCLDLDLKRDIMPGILLGKYSLLKTITIITLLWLVIRGPTGGN